MQIYGGMQFRTLSIMILGRSTKGMREMKGYIDIGFLRWKELCHHLNMNL
jgi:hypothetical protein